MKELTIEDYRRMSQKFNKLNFVQQIEVLRDSPGILQLGSDYNWWRVLVVDNIIQEQLDEEENTFVIDTEWDHNHMYELVNLLGIKQTGL